MDGVLYFEILFLAKTVAPIFNSNFELNFNKFKVFKIKLICN